MNLAGLQTLYQYNVYANQSIVLSELGHLLPILDPIIQFVKESRQSWE